MTIPIIIASKNPIKIEATRKAFLNYFKQIYLESYDPKILSQPIGEKETYETSRRRVKLVREKNPDANFYVGIEGGISLNFYDVPRIIVYCSVANHSYIETLRGCEIPLAKAWYDSLTKWEYQELGDLVSDISGIKNIKQREGAIGYLTGNYVNRVDILTHGVAVALIPFTNRSIFPIIENNSEKR